MSDVTGLTLIASVTDDEAVAALRQWMVGQGRPEWSLGGDLSESAGGGKHPQNQLYSAGLNYFGDGQSALADLFLSLKWEEPEAAILVLQPEEGPALIYRPEHRA